MTEDAASRRSSAFRRLSVVFRQALLLARFGANRSTRVEIRQVRVRPSDLSILASCGGIVAVSVRRLTRCEGAWFNRLALRRGAVSRARHLDIVDKSIIEALQKNGRESFRRIAAEVGVSEATVRARYARLCEDTILQGTAVTNPLGLGFDGQAMVGIRTAGPPEPVADEIAKWDEADYVVITAGQFDLLVELVCDDRRHLLQVTNRMRALDGVVSTESFLYLELWKQLYDWGALIDGREPAEATVGG